MKATISTLLLFVIGVSYVSSQSCHMRELDLCLATGLFHFQSSGVPDNDEKVTEWCDTIKEVKECGNNYSGKCMSPMQKELTGILAGGGFEVERQFCTPGSEIRNRYLKHGACISGATQTDAFKTYVRDLQAAAELVLDATFKDRLPIFCCAFHRFRNAMEDTTRSLCSEDAVDMLSLMVNMMITDLPQTVCQAFDVESVTCKRVLPPSGSQPQGSASKSQFANVLDTALSGFL